ncbi:hypothetical protein COCON_G00228940 [Conger conger]|uniref:Poly [ADP-ribose] polymerase n=1 Tax=Conger conger TaxID=82655 RepID=A0A9Q1HMJ9_CONCO|nr:hypothetical protein COCON_G00228940 [Conger conger]
MAKNNEGRSVMERQLFHGTESKHMDAICKQNFDWRICGTHGTAYGKGSYFARDARYSHGYTGASGVRTMFVCRVLVGCYTRGDSSYLRPYSKDGDSVFYDSCVDNIHDTTIFVVFEKHQIYPEYLIRYCEEERDSPVRASRGVQPVYFDAMTRGPTQVRRLSTVSSVVQPTFILTTTWAWY